MEPEAEPQPSAPPPEPPPFNPELITEAVRDFLRGAEGRALVEAAVARALKGSLDAEARKAREGLRQAREAEVAEFTRSAGQLAEDAARTEVQRLRAMVQAAAATEVRREADRAVPGILRDDPRMKRLLDAHLQSVRAAVQNAADRELAEICDEDRYHRVNRAFLAALDRRCQDAIEKTEAQVEQAVQQARWPALFSQVLSVGAFVVAVAGLVSHRSRM